jgi:hypothetical protein
VGEQVAEELHRPDDGEHAGADHQPDGEGRVGGG